MSDSFVCPAPFTPCQEMQAAKPATPKGANSFQYYFCSIMEVLDGYEFTSYFLLKIHAQDDCDKRFDTVFSNYRGEGSKESDDVVSFPCGITARDPSISEISVDEYQVLKNHISVISPHFNPAI